MAISKHLVSISNLITLLLSIPILGAGILLASNHHTDCLRFLQGPVISIGLFMFVISIVGFVGAHRRITWLLWVYLFVMFLLIVLLFCFTIFALAVTNQGAGEALSGKGYKDYRLGDYSSWLRKRVDNAKNWEKIKSCLRDARICQSLSVYKLATDFNKAELSSVQSGCCKPPTSCNYLFLNATYWARPLSENADPDCHKYSYIQSELCFDCDSCRAGVLDRVKQDWRKVAVVNLVMFIVLIVVYAAGCHTFHRAQEEGRYVRYGKGIF